MVELFPIIKFSGFKIKTFDRIKELCPILAPMAFNKITLI